MAKLALLLAVLAAAAAGYAALRPLPAHAPASPGGSEGGPDAAVARLAKDAARAEADARVAAAFADLDRRIAKLDQMRKQIEGSVAEARRLGEASADAVAARVDTVERDARQAIRALRTELEASHSRTPAPGPSGSTDEIRPGAEPEPARPVEPEPEPEPEEAAPPSATPTPAPAAPAMSEAERAEIDKALANLDGKETNVVFAAIETLRTKKVREAGPRLVKLLATSKDPYLRMGAAAALGGIGIADGVDALIEALVDEDVSVAGQASKAIRRITGVNLDFSAKAGIRERRKAKSEMKQWWKEHEQEVRDRLGQPKAASNDGA
jgi:HEAT repeat protein